MAALWFTLMICTVASATTAHTWRGCLAYMACAAVFATLLLNSLPLWREWIGS